MLPEMLLLFGALGCGGTPMDQQLPVDRSRAYAVAIDTLGSETIIPAPADRIWSALTAVLADEGLEINYRNPAERRIGSCYQKTRIRLGTTPLSSLVECGDSRGVPNADRYEVAMTVLTTVVPVTANTSKVYTFVIGVGLEASGAASNRIWCYSKGALERRIVTGIEQRVSGS